MSTDHIVELNASQLRQLERWLWRPSGSLALGRVTFEAVSGGGLLVRTRPFQQELAKTSEVRPARQTGKTAASEAWIAEQEAAGHTVLRVGTTKAEPTGQQS